MGEFTRNSVADPSSGIGYVYHKKISVAADQPKMLIEHSLSNTGTHAIETSVYDHNFLVLDKQATGPGFTITFPFALSSDRTRSSSRNLRNQIVSSKLCRGDRLHHRSGFQQECAE